MLVPPSTTLRWASMMAAPTASTAYGIIRVRPSPGHTPNTLPLPRPAIDFDAVDILNAPWATPADLDAVTALGEGIVNGETDIALPVINAHLADMDNPHNVTPAPIGAITTNQLDAALEGVATVADVANDIAGLNTVYLGINAKADSATFSDNAANAEVASFAHDADRANSAYSAENVNGFTVGIMCLMMQFLRTLL